MRCPLKLLVQVPLYDEGKASIDVLTLNDVRDDDDSPIPVTNCVSERNV